MSALPTLTTDINIKEAQSQYEADEKEEEKQEISSLPMRMPTLNNQSKSEPNVQIPVTFPVAQQLSVERAQRVSSAISLLQSHIQTLCPNDTDKPWRYGTSNIAKSTKAADMNNSNIPDLTNLRSKSHDYHSPAQPPQASYYQHFKNNHTYQAQPQPHVLSVNSPISPNNWDNNCNYNKYFHFPTNIPCEPSPRTLQNADKELRLKAPAWDSPYNFTEETEICTLIYGAANPISMYPDYKYPTIPYVSDNLCGKRIYNVSVAKEGHHCFGISGSNDWCFVWGSASQFVGVLGLGTNTTETTPFLIRSLRKQRVKQTCCSSLHSLCITEDLVIYGWGNKRLTLLNSDTNKPPPLRYLNHKGLRCLSACNTHSLAWNPHKSIHIYSFGIAGPWLGYDNDMGPVRIRSTFGLVKLDHYIYSNSKYAVASADCCAQFTLILLNTGYVGCCGINKHGRMGIGKHIIASSKVLWSSSADLKQIVRVSAGNYHSGFVDVHGRVYTCGYGYDYRLGHAECDAEILYKPRMVTALQRVKAREIECVDKRTYVITTGGHLILFGKEPDAIDVTPASDEETSDSPEKDAGNGQA